MILGALATSEGCLLYTSSLERLRPGDVIRVPTGRRAGYAVVVAANRGAPGRPASPAVVTEDRQLRRLTTVDVPTPVQPLLTVRIPTGFNAKSPKSRRDLAATLRIACLLYTSRCV